jgi:hypothetical protein
MLPVIIIRNKNIFKIAELMPENYESILRELFRQIEKMILNDNSQIVYKRT